MRHSFNVQFQREFGDDIEFARKHFPGDSEADQLRGQLGMELVGNERLINKSQLGSVRRTAQGTYYVDATFAWDTETEDRTAALQELRAELQNCYDVYGMAGLFNIVEDTFTPIQFSQDWAMRAAMGICHDLHEGHVPGCGICLSLENMQAAREYIADLLRREPQ